MPERTHLESYVLTLQVLRRERDHGCIDDEADADFRALLEYDYDHLDAREQLVVDRVAAGLLSLDEALARVAGSGASEST